MERVNAAGVDSNGVSGAEWWKAFHLLEMADLFLDARTPQVLRETTEFLLRALQLEEGDHVYDQCCGSGSLSIALANRSLQVTGVDLCEAYIDRAHENALGIEEESNELQQPEFYCADAFEFIPATPCAGVFNWYSSFGYSCDDQRNQMMLQRAFDALKPEGRFALDVLNLPFVLRTFRPTMTHEGVSAGRHVLLNRASELALGEGLLKQTWNWEIEGMPRVERVSSVRLYLPHQIREMLLSCGFQRIECFGDLQCNPLNIDSPRLIITAQRPRS